MGGGNKRLPQGALRPVQEPGRAASGEHGIGNGRLEYFKEFVGDRIIELHKAIKMAFDPNLVLNPGKVVEFNS